MEDPVSIGRGRSHRAVAKALATSLGLNLALLVWLAIEGFSGPSQDSLSLQRVLDEPAIRERVVDELVAEARGIMDSHNDPDVGRVLQPRIDVERDSVRIRTNSFGIRERQYELPKPADTVRVVFLGDSLVEGIAVPEEERCGRHLERFLRERSGADGLRIEALNIGVGSWNLEAECAYLRRQLSLLQPDLVVHVTVENDLSDMTGVRGFGAMAAFSPAYRERADSRIGRLHPGRLTGKITRNSILLAADHESRERYRRASAAIARLAAEVEAAGGRYVMILHWGGDIGFAIRHLTHELDADQLAFIGDDHAKDPTYWVSATDSHWNGEGMEVIAKLTYGLAVRRNLLPRLQLESWDEAESWVERVHDPGEREALEAPQSLDLSELLLPSVGHPFTEASARHVYGGIDKDGLVSPHASMILGLSHPGRLRVRGRPLGRPEIAGATVEVLADEVSLGTFRVGQDDPIDASWELPPSLAGRGAVTIRLVSDDYAYTGDDLQHCVVFRLVEIACVDP